MSSNKSSIQDWLSKYQTTPLVGPFIGSPIKALLSTAELISGVAFSIIFGTLFMLTGSTTLGTWTMNMGDHTDLGVRGLIYSLVNFVSLGWVGYRIEKLHGTI